MRILYAVQVTGNGHISRAMDVIPELQKHGQVDVILSGSNSHLNPGFEVAFRCRGLSLFYNPNGGLDYLRILKHTNPYRIYREATQLPVERYDLIINDFDSVTSLACRLKKIPSIQFGHQASFHSPKTPRPNKREFLGELVLKKYAEATAYCGLHFREYDSGIFPPILKQEIWNAEKTDQEHITVYLPQFSAAHLLPVLQRCSQFRFEAFCAGIKEPAQVKNVYVRPISRNGFSNSMICSHGVLTGGGFETPTEAMVLGKRLLVIPIRGQYEQLCNAEALKEWNIPILKQLEQVTPELIKTWFFNTVQKPYSIRSETKTIVNHMINMAAELHKMQPVPV